MRYTDIFSEVPKPEGIPHSLQGLKNLGLLVMKHGSRPSTRKKYGLTKDVLFPLEDDDSLTFFRVSGTRYAGGGREVRLAVVDKAPVTAGIMLTAAAEMDDPMQEAVQAYVINDSVPSRTGLRRIFSEVVPADSSAGVIEALHRSTLALRLTRPAQVQLTDYARAMSLLLTPVIPDKLG